MHYGNSDWKKLIIKMFMIFGLFTLTVLVFAITYLWDTIGNSYEQIDRIDDDNKGVASGASKDVLDEPINVLLLGVDNNQTEVGRSDTIMVIRLNPDAKTITVVSLPRDTYTEIVGKDYKDKINHALVYGGVPTALASVENFFDIHIDYYAKIDFKGFEKAIDTLGGIEIDVEKRMKYTDVAGGLYIDLQPGLQTLDGKDALGYARFRNDEKGDLGRIERQQVVIKALLDKSTEFRSATRIFELMDIVGDHFKTDIPRTDLLKIITTYRTATSENLISEKVNGESKRFGEQSLWYFVVEDQEKERLHSILTQ